MSQLSRSTRSLLAALTLVPALALAPGAHAALSVTSKVGSVDAINQGLNPRVAVGDFNGDGVDDHAVATRDGAGTVYFGARGSAAGGGTLRFTAKISDQSELRIDSAGDFDGDGFDDLLLLQQRAATRAFVLHGAATNPATLDVPTSARTTTLNLGAFSADRTAAGAGLGDFNGDGKDDLVVPSTAGTSAGNGPIGLSVIAGGPRVATLDARTAGGRVSRIDGFVRCTTTFIIYFPYFRSYCHRPAPSASPVGDVNGDGLADLYVNAREGRAESILLGRAAGGFSVRAVSPGAASVSLNALPGGGPNGFASGVGDVNGDGIGDVHVASGIALGRRNLPTTLPANEPTLKIEAPQGISTSLMGPIGDQTGDGRTDLLVERRAGSYSTNNELVVASLPAGATAFSLAAQSTVGGSRPSGDYGVTGSASGDLDGDGRVDAVVTDNAAFYRLTHSGELTRPRLQVRTVYRDVVNDELHAPSALDVTATCDGVTRSASLRNQQGATFGEDDAFTLGAKCTITTTAKPPLDARYADCDWQPTYTFRGAALAAGASVTLASDPNIWMQTFTCRRAVEDDLPKNGFNGWTQSGSAVTTPSKLTLTNGPSQTSSVVWPKAFDPHRKTISFDLAMDGGTGAAEGITLAFLTNVGGQPSDVIGAGGGQLGFGGLTGQALGFDAYKQPEDAQANTISLVNGPLGASLSKSWTKDAGFRLRGGVRRIGVYIHDDSIGIVVNNISRHVIPVSLPNSVFIAFTGSTSTTWQHQSVSNLEVSAHPAR